MVGWIKMAWLIDLAAGQDIWPLSHKPTGRVHCKKELAGFPSPAGMSLIKLFLGGNNLVFSLPERVWSVTSRLGTGKWLTPFYSVRSSNGHPEGIKKSKEGHPFSLYFRVSDISTTTSTNQVISAYLLLSRSLSSRWWKGAVGGANSSHSKK